MVTRTGRPRDAVVEVEFYSSVLDREIRAHVEVERDGVATVLDASMDDGPPESCKWVRVTLGDADYRRARELAMEE